VIEDIRQIVEKKLAQMLARNPLRMNYEKKYQEIIAAYNQTRTGPPWKTPLRS
jgi:type I restriction enzyme R subunit